MSGHLPCRCGCARPGGARVHHVADALAVDDVDQALDAGLFDVEPCPACTPDCTASLVAARDARRVALAARERYRARAARLQRIAAEREAHRAVRAAPAETTPGRPVPPPLPPVAAAALARAKARAGGRT
jgi:hypothetical protein